MRTITLVRGLPGSGKSTFAKLLANARCVHLEADMFFELGDCGYQFDASKLKDAHAWCQHQVELAMADADDVVVSNTFVKRWEMQAYINLAMKYGYRVIEVTVNGNHGSIHNVPEATIERMRLSWEV